MNILIIEDSKAEAHILGKTLCRILDEETSIHHKETLGDARVMLAECNDTLDLVFLDLSLPDSDG